MVQGQLDYEWYDTQSYYDSNGNAANTAELDDHFDSGVSGVTFGGSGTWSRNDISWGGRSQSGPAGTVGSKPSYLPQETFSWKVVGYVYAPESGQYTFAVDSDDASDVLVSENVTANFYDGHGFSGSWTSGSGQNTGTYTLDAGEVVTFAARQQEGEFGDGIQVGWQKPRDGSIGLFDTVHTHDAVTETNSDYSTDFSTFEDSRWHVRGSATYESSNDRMRLNAGTGSTSGSVTYVGGQTADSWTADFTFTNGADGADEVTFIFYGDGVSGSERPYSGYYVTYDHYNDQIQLIERSGGSGNVLAQTNKTIGAGTYNGKVEYNNGTVSVFFEGTEQFSHTISNVSKPGREMGYGARDGGTTGTHYLDSASLTFVGPPSKPQNVTATASGDDITVSWDAVSWNGDVGEYLIKRAETGGGPYTQIATVPDGTTTYTDSGLEDGEKFYYVVEATNSSSSSMSAEGAAVTDLPAVDSVYVDLSWVDESNNEDGFKVYRDGSVVATLGADTTSYTDAPLDGQTTYTYEVASFTEHAASLSGSSSITTSAASQYTISASLDSNDDVIIEWVRADDSTDGGIDVKRSTDGFSTVTTVASGLAPSTTSYTDSTVTGGETYDYRIERNTNHATAQSSSVSVSVPLGRPENLAIDSTTSSSITLSWTDTAENESGYRVYRSTDGGTFSEIASLSQNTTTFTDTGLNDGDTYYYYVEAYNGEFESISDSVAAPASIVAASTDAAATLSQGVVSSLAETTASPSSGTSLAQSAATTGSGLDGATVGLASVLVQDTLSTSEATAVGVETTSSVLPFDSVERSLAALSPLRIDSVSTALQPTSTTFAQTISERSPADATIDDIIAEALSTDGASLAQADALSEDVLSLGLATSPGEFQTVKTQFKTAAESTRADESALTATQLSSPLVTDGVSTSLESASRSSSVTTQLSGSERSATFDIVPETDAVTEQLSSTEVSSADLVTDTIVQTLSSLRSTSVGGATPGIINPDGSTGAEQTDEISTAFGSSALSTTASTSLFSVATAGSSESPQTIGQKTTSITSVGELQDAGLQVDAVSTTPSVVSTDSSSQSALATDGPSVGASLSEPLNTVDETRVSVDGELTSSATAVQQCTDSPRALDEATYTDTTGDVRQSNEIAASQELSSLSIGEARTSVAVGPVDVTVEATIIASSVESPTSTGTTVEQAVSTTDATIRTASTQNRDTQSSASATPAVEAVDADSGQEGVRAVPTVAPPKSPASTDVGDSVTSAAAISTTPLTESTSLAESSDDRTTVEESPSYVSADSSTFQADGNALLSTDALSTASSGSTVAVKAISSTSAETSRISIGAFTDDTIPAISSVEEVANILDSKTVAGDGVTTSSTTTGATPSITQADTDTTIDSSQSSESANTVSVDSTESKSSEIASVGGVGSLAVSASSPVTATGTSETDESAVIVPSSTGITALIGDAREDATSTTDGVRQAAAVTTDDGESVSTALGAASVTPSISAAPSAVSRGLSSDEATSTDVIAAGQQSTQMASTIEQSSRISSLSAVRSSTSESDARDDVQSTTVSAVGSAARSASIATTDASIQSSGSSQLPADTRSVALDTSRKSDGGASLRGTLDNSVSQDIASRVLTVSVPAQSINPGLSVDAPPTPAIVTEFVTTESADAEDDAIRQHTTATLVTSDELSLALSQGLPITTVGGVLQLDVSATADSTGTITTSSVLVDNPSSISRASGSPLLTLAAAEQSVPTTLSTVNESPSVTISDAPTRITDVDASTFEQALINEVGSLSLIGDSVAVSRTDAGYITTIVVPVIAASMPDRYIARRSANGDDSSTSVKTSTNTASVNTEDRTVTDNS